MAKPSLLNGLRPREGSSAVRTEQIPKPDNQIQPDNQIHDLFFFGQTKSNILLKSDRISFFVLEETIHLSLTL